MISIEIVIVRQLAQDQHDQAGQHHVEPVDRMEYHVSLGDNVANVLPRQSEHLDHAQLVVLHVGAGNVPSIAHNAFVLGEQLTQPHAKFTGAVPGIPTE